MAMGSKKGLLRCKIFQRANRDGTAMRRVAVRFHTELRVRDQVSAPFAAALGSRSSTERTNRTSSESSVLP